MARVLGVRARYSLYFSLLAGNWVREEFAQDCVHQAPLFFISTLPRGDGLTELQRRGAARHAFLPITDGARGTWPASKCWNLVRNPRGGALKSYTRPLLSRRYDVESRKPTSPAWSFRIQFFDGKRSKLRFDPKTVAGLS